MAMPLEIIGLGKGEVTFVWTDDDSDVWGARELRLRCVCAMCRSEATGERILDESKVPELVTIEHMELMGNYGVHIHFSDGHTTGIFRFADLRRSR